MTPSESISHSQAIIKAIDRSRLHLEPVITKEGIQTRRWELNVPDESEIKKRGHNFISIWDLKKREETEVKPVESTKPVASLVSQAKSGDTWVTKTGSRAFTKQPDGSWKDKAGNVLSEEKLIQNHGNNLVPQAKASEAIDQAIKKEAKPAVEPESEELSDDPNSPNYRYKDTGYIAGSRKEEAANQIRQAGRSGNRLRATDVNWNEIEKNPREAKELIVKSNLFGEVDWEDLKAKGMEPSAGFIIDRIYASIASSPSEDNPRARQDYAIGLESLRDRLEACKTVEEVSNLLREMSAEYEGVNLNPQEAEEYAKAGQAYRELSVKSFNLEKEHDKLSNIANNIRYEINNLKYEISKREKKGLKPDPKLEEKRIELEDKHPKALDAFKQWNINHPEFQETTETTKDESGSTSRVRSPLRDEMRKQGMIMEGIKLAAKLRNRLENPIHRAWGLMGKRFINIINWRSYKGSDKFKEHMTLAKTGKINDWSWAEKERVSVKGPSKKQVAFQLLVAENFERKGGRAISVESTEALKQQFGIRDVQLGNWVADDPGSARFHVRSSAEALSDLADLLGVPDDALWVNKRIALALGARGRGSWQGSSRAHYEPVERVINITKMGGGGALAHEIFHAIDNLMIEVETGKSTGKDVNVTERYFDLLSDGDLKNAVRGLYDVVANGTNTVYGTMEYTNKDVRLAQSNLVGYSRSVLPDIIKDAGSIKAAIIAINRRYEDLEKKVSLTDKMKKKNERERSQWKRMAAAWYDGMNPGGGFAKVPIKDNVSSFRQEAVRLDMGEPDKYWSATHELTARAFQSWVEDRLAEKGRKSDYLSAMADNKHYKDAIDSPKPYPEGEERTRINQAFDKLFEVLRANKTLQKALNLVEL